MVGGDVRALSAGVERNSEENTFLYKEWAQGLAETVHRVL